MIGRPHQPIDLLLFGESRIASSPVLRQKGPFSFTFESGMLKHLRIRDLEIARRVYFAVRDEKWGTVPNDISAVQFSESSECFEVIWSGRCQAHPVDYEWKGRIRIFTRGLVEFKAEGKTLRNFKTPRIGLCLLLATTTVLDRMFEISTLDGQTEQLQFEPMFKRTQLACRWTSLRLRPETGILVEYAIEGSYFDLEDQRNFGDVSYKAMAGMPFENQQALAGNTSEQLLTIRVHSNADLSQASHSDPDSAVKLNANPDAISGKVPEIGFDLGDLDASALSDRFPLISDLPIFLHGWLDCAAPTLSKRASQIEAIALRTARPLYLTLENLDSENLTSVVQILLHWRKQGLHVLQLDVLGSAHPELMLLRACVREAELHAPCGKRVASFKDRAGLLEAANSGADFLAWCGTPLSHQNDDETLLENAAVFSHQAAVAKCFAPSMGLTVGPVRLNDSDPRYRGLIGAAFVASSVRSMALGSVDRALFFDAIGPNGHIDTQLQPLPSYYVSGQLSSFSGRSMFPIDSSDPLRVQAFGVNGPTGKVVLVVNQTPVVQEAGLTGIGTWDAEVWIRSLNASSFSEPRSAHCDSASSRLQARMISLSNLLSLEPFSVNFLSETGA